MLIIFVPIKPYSEETLKITKENFKKRIFLNRQQSENKKFNELSDIIWLDEYQVENIFSSQPKIQMFAKVRRFIHSCRSFSKEISVMKNLLAETINYTIIN